MSRSEASESSPAPGRLERWTQRTRSAVQAWPNWAFFLGLLLGFGGCVVAGRIQSQRQLFHDFVRFFQPIQPQQSFYPTASQLIAQVRHTVPPGRIPVIVGGASYFRGTGQNQRELWSVELQRLLGDRYTVVNLAIDAAEITSFAAVAFAALAREYPDILYVANGSPLAGASWDGGQDYGYLFWDAYYKGLLPPSIADSERIRGFARDQRRKTPDLEHHLGAWIDSFTYGRDLWTRVGYEDFFTVWTASHATVPFRPRRHDRDNDENNFREAQLNQRKDPGYIRHSENSAHEGARVGFRTDKRGQTEPDPEFWARMGREWRALFPDELRSKCFVVFLRGNPYFMQTLTPEERAHTEQQYEIGRKTLEREGYRVVQLRGDDFNADDYLDGGHLMPSGGFKVARAVATRIDEVARTDAAIRSLRHPPAGALTVKISLPAARQPREEPLAILAGPEPDYAAAETLFIDYLGGARVRFGYSRGRAGDVVYSAPLDWPDATPHELRLSTDGLYPLPDDAVRVSASADQLSRLKSWFLLQVDGQPFWEIPLPPAAVASKDGVLHFGKDLGARAHGREFTGTIHSATRERFPALLPARDRLGGARVRLTLPAGAGGRALPLVTTGVAQAGDVLFVRVGPGGMVRFGYDHWAGPLLLSGAIRFGLDTPRTVEFRVPALGGNGSPREVEVRLDGQVVWRRQVEVFPAGALNVYFGQNPIGASTAEPVLENAVFEGVLEPGWGK